MARRKLSSTEWLLIFAVCAIVAWQVMPFFETVRDRNMNTIWTSNNLRQIGLGSLNYAEAYGELPAVKKNRSEQALYSWRVSLLPFIEHADLYKQFRHDE